MDKLHKFAQKLTKVIWVEDIQYWFWWNIIGKWRTDKHLKEGQMPCMWTPNRKGNCHICHTSNQFTIIMSNYKFKTTNIRGKQYVEVNERIKFFRQEDRYKDWTIAH